MKGELRSALGLLTVTIWAAPQRELLKQTGL